MKYGLSFTDLVHSVKSVIPGEWPRMITACNSQGMLMWAEVAESDIRKRPRCKLCERRAVK